VTLNELKKADIIVLTIPVDAIIAFNKQLDDLPQTTTVIDFGSTKQMIVEALPQALKSHYIPAHPMTGTEKFGPSAACDALYENKTIVLCDLEYVQILHKQRVLKIFETIGMNIVYMNSSNHDVHACFMSHLPHAISFSLATTVMSHEDPNSIIALAAGGFNDMSRVAKSSPNMWSDVFRQNKDNLIKSIDLFQNQMDYAKKLIENEEFDKLNDWMKKANTLHDIL
ncbi:MAG: prephenate dehydrogenase, partial [Campylobacterota bacterium]|nr:prephenate dehydrogenase [Campylobacterota bacterium]